jgi:hypothetical protein
MPGKSQSHTDAVLNILRGSALAGVTPYVGLFSGAPADDASAGTELAGNGYARQAIVFGAPATDAGNIRKISNTNSIQFGPAQADWSQAVAFGVFDTQAGGNVLYWDALTTSKTVLSGDYGQFAPGTLVVKED